jgi:hypothetical protein
MSRSSAWSERRRRHLVQVAWRLAWRLARRSPRIGGPVREDPIELRARQVLASRGLADETRLGRHAARGRPWLRYAPKSQVRAAVAVAYGAWIRPLFGLGSPGVSGGGRMPWGDPR